jgi:hypothetical protein
MENIKNKQEFSQTEFMARFEAFAKAANDVISLTDLAANTTKSWTVFSKDTLRQYLQSPYAATSQTQLRNLARFLYTLSFPLRRLIQYFASIPDFSVYKVIPDYSLVEDNDEEALLQDFEDTCKFVRGLGLDLNMFRLLINGYRDDIMPFYPLTDETTGETYMMPLDSQYCKISGIGYNGVYRVAFDFSFFNGSTGAWYLENWPKEFQTLYNKYQSDSSLRWQQLESARAFKLNVDQPDLVLSPLVGLFEQIIDLIDLQSISSVKTALEAYKMLVMEIPLIDGQTPDDYAISLNVAKKFYNKMIENLPEEVIGILSPMKISPVTFDKNATSTNNEISDSLRNLFETSGVSQIMDASRLTGQSAVKMSMLTDVMMGTKSIIPQVEAWVNEQLRLIYPNTKMYVKFTNVTVFTKDDRITQLQKAAEFGLPVKMELMSTLGYNPLESIGADWIETKLGLSTERFVHPLVSSHTASAIGSDDGGRPTAEESGDGLTDDGEASRDKIDAIN